MMGVVRIGNVRILQLANNAAWIRDGVGVSDGILVDPKNSLW